jgi:hypothetical protein
MASPLDDAVSCFRNERDFGVRGRLTRVWAGVYLYRNGPSWEPPELA